jgi:cysteine desulfurase / selenocysteine lyase
MAGSSSVEGRSATGAVRAEPISSVRGAIAEVRVVRNRAGAVPVDAFAELVDDRTRAVVVSSVQWTNGYAVDLHALADLCRAHDALLVVDAIQQLGATRLDVRDVAADVVSRAATSG